MSTSNRAVTMVSAYVVPLILLLWCGVGEGGPLGFGLINDFFDVGNGTSLLANLALAHIEHKLDTIGALADLASLIANITGTAFIG